MRCMTLLTSATIDTGSATGLRRRRRRFLILAIGSGASFGCLRGPPGRRLRLGRAVLKTCLAPPAGAAPGCFFARFLAGIS